MGAQPADATPPLPPSLPVGRQESGHLLCKLSDDNHHLMAPQRQRGPCVQRLWPLLQAAQCRSARLARPASRGTAALRAAASSVAWLGKPPRAPEGLPTRGASWLAGRMGGAGAGGSRTAVSRLWGGVWGAALAPRGPNALQAAGRLHAVKGAFLKMAAVLAGRRWWAVGLWKWAPSPPRASWGWASCSGKGAPPPENSVVAPR